MLYKNIKFMSINISVETLKMYYIIDYIIPPYEFIDFMEMLKVVENLKPNVCKVENPLLIDNI